MHQNDSHITVVNKWNNRALDMLYNTYYKALVVYAANILDDVTVAEDIVQDSIASIWQRRPLFSSDIQLKAYIYNSVRNGALNYLRKQKSDESRVRLTRLTEACQSLSEEEEDRFFETDVTMLLFQMIDDLPARQRQVFLLAMEGKRNAEIAEQLSITQNTVKVLKQRALATLKSKASDKLLIIVISAFFAE